MTSPPEYDSLSPEVLDALARADDALSAIGSAAARDRVGWEVVHTSWAIDEPDAMWCYVDAEYFLAVGGPAWSGVLGYETAALVGRRWADLIAPADLASSHGIVAANIARGTGVEHFENFYKHATSGTTHRVVWRISPWARGRAVARGVVQA